MSLGNLMSLPNKTDILWFTFGMIPVEKPLKNKEVALLFK
jgi:hypothetical protein